jgi:hypothetical protein
VGSDGPRPGEAPTHGYSEVGQILLHTQTSGIRIEGREI